MQATPRSLAAALVLAGTSWFVPAAALPIDAVFVMDRSSQITGVEFAQEKSFIINAANSVTFGPADAQAALVGFAATGAVIQSLTASSATFVNAVNIAAFAGGDACLSCGLEAARVHLQTLGRSGTCKTIIVLTDGNANQPAPDPAGAASAAADLIAAAGFDLYTVGVGGDANVAFLTSLTRGAGTYNSDAAFSSFLSDWLVPCQATPVEQGSWSRLKLMYR